MQQGKLQEYKTSEGNGSLGSLHPCYHGTSHHPVQKHVRLQLYWCVCLCSGASNGRVSLNLTPQLVITLLVFSLNYSGTIYSHLVQPTLSCLLNNCFCLPSDHTLTYWQTAYIFAAPTMLELNKLTQLVFSHKQIISLFASLSRGPPLQLTWFELRYSEYGRPDLYTDMGCLNLWPSREFWMESGILSMWLKASGKQSWFSDPSFAQSLRVVHGP